MIEISQNYTGFSAYKIKDIQVLLNALEIEIEINSIQEKAPQEVAAHKEVINLLLLKCLIELKFGYEAKKATLNIKDDMNELNRILI
jgi:hypothetical protein